MKNSKWLDRVVRHFVSCFMCSKCSDALMPFCTFVCQLENGFRNGCVCGGCQSASFKLCGECYGFNIILLYFHNLWITSNEEIKKKVVRFKNLKIFGMKISEGQLFRWWLSSGSFPVNWMTEVFCDDARSGIALKSPTFQI